MPEFAALPYLLPHFIWPTLLNIVIDLEVAQRQGHDVALALALAWAELDKRSGPPFALQAHVQSTVEQRLQILAMRKEQP